MTKTLQELGKQTTALETVLRSHADASLGRAVHKLRQTLKTANTQLLDRSTRR